MSENIQSRNLLAFKKLNYVFWAVWALVPILYVKIWQLQNDPATYTQGLTPEQVSCMKEIVNPATFSTTGTYLYNLPLLSAFLFYAFLIFSFHRMVYRFANGGAFDAFTLKNMKTLGYALIGYPFFEFALNYFVSWALQYTGDVKFAIGPVFVDITVVAAGFFVIALMIVLKNAIELKSENDLTI